MLQQQGWAQLTKAAKAAQQTLLTAAKPPPQQQQQLQQPLRPWALAAQSAAPAVAAVQP
jgi:hypothetical protein